MQGLDPAVWAGLVAALLTAYAAYRKIRPEAESANAVASRENVEMSRGIAADLREDIEHLRGELEQVKRDHDLEMKEIRVELIVVRRERDELRRENVTLRDRVAGLEARSS